MDVVEVAVADGGSSDLHPHFVGSGRPQVQVLDDERLAELVADGGFHD